MKNKKFIIYGLGRSGFEVAKYLILKGFEVIITDDNENSLENFLINSKKDKQLSQNNTILQKIIKSDKICDLIDKNSIIIMSPGIALYYPVKHKILDYIKSKGAKLICDIELFCLINNRNKKVAVTGTNGKSTTVSLIDYILKNLNKDSKLGGNVGKAVFGLMNENEISLNSNLILELSSYQLDLIEKSQFDVAAISNITRDHIDRHGNFENYQLAKESILKNLTKDDYAVLNYDDKNLAQIINKSVKSGNNNVLFSIKSNLESGVYIKNDFLVDNFFNKSGQIKIKLPEFKIKGQHNLQNIVLSYCCCVALLKKKGEIINKELCQKIINIIADFSGLRHRAQLVKKIGNVNFINDSKATNAESCQKALESFKNILWILGGVAKEGGISNLGPYLKNVKKSYLIGSSSKEFAKFLKKNDVNYELCVNLEEAVKKSYEDSKLLPEIQNVNILLSPSCASFDMWENFEERGNDFCKLVNEIA